MNSDDDEALKKLFDALDELRERYPVTRFTCDFCNDETSQPVFINEQQDSVICWSCITNMHDSVANMEWLHSVDWDKLSRH